MERTISVKAAQHSKRYDLQFYAGESLAFVVQDRPEGAVAVLTIGADTAANPIIELTGQDAIFLDVDTLAVIPEGRQWKYNFWMKHNGTAVLIRYGAFDKLESLAPTQSDSEPGNNPSQPLTGIAAPVISGSAQVGQVLQCSEGGWIGSAPRSFSYQWLRNGAAIEGAIGPSYEVVPDDDGISIACTVTADDGFSQIMVTSTAVSITFPPLSNLALPVISGSFTTGETLFVSDGLWSGPVTLGQQWTRGGVDIGGATSASYEILPNDAGETIGCRVTAQNSGGVMTVQAAGVRDVVAGGATDGALLLVIAGQSNSRTAGTSSATPPTRYTDGSLGDVNIFLRGTGDNVMIEIADGAFAAYDVTSNADPDNSSTAWGSEAEFIYQMRQAGDMRPVYVVKESQNGQSLAEDWHPDASADNFEQLEAKIVEVRAALAGLSLEEVTLWNQGEADANILAYSEAYAANWAYFLEQYRSRVSAGLFIAERIRPLGYEGASITDNSRGFLQAWMVREATLAGAVADGNALVVDTDFDTSNFSSIHPTEPWIENKGLRCYAAYAGTYDATYGSILDTVPDAFDFADAIDVTPAASVSSAAILIEGIERQTPVLVTGGEFRTLNSLDGDYVVSDWAPSGFVDKFQKIQLRTMASGDASTSSIVAVDIGGVTDTWAVTTYASAPSFEPETEAFMDQVAANGGLGISGADASALDAFYVSAKASTWFGKLLKLYLRLGDQVASSLDLVGQSESLALVNPSGQPYVWSAAAGWTPQETSNTGLDLGVNPSTELPQDGSTLGIFYSALATNTRGDLNGGNGVFLRATNAGAARYLLNSGGNSNASGLTTDTGMRAVVRDGASSLRLHGPDGAIINTATAPSIPPTGTSLSLGNATTGGETGIQSDARFFGGFAAGAALTEAELQSLAITCEDLLSHFAG